MRSESPTLIRANDQAAEMTGVQAYPTRVTKVDNAAIAFGVPKGFEYGMIT